MAWSFHASGSGGNTAPGKTALSTSASVAVNAGDLICLQAGWESSNGGTVTAGGATKNALTQLAMSNNGTLIYGCFFWLVATDTITEVFTINWTSGVTAPEIIVHVFTPTAGNTVSLDVGPSGGVGSGTAAASGSVSPNGPESLVFGSAYQDNNGAGIGTFKIGADAADGSIISPSNLGASWYKTGNTGSLTANCAVSNGSWLCDVISFKSVSGGGMPGYEILKSNNPQIAMRRGGR